jgi:hypothetical protein
MDTTIPDLTPIQKAPAPEVLAEEEALWRAVLEAFEDEDRHNRYIGFVIKNNLLKNGSRRYGEFARDKERRSVEHRRIANLKQQQIAKILFFVPETKTAGGPREQSKAEMSAVLGGVVLGLFGLAFGLFGPRNFAFLRVVSFILSLVVFGGGGYYVYRKVREGAERLNRER